MTEEQITAVRQGVIDDWLAATKAETDISSEVEPSPTPSAQQFVPPADAPPLPTATIEPPLSSPIASPATVDVIGP